MRKLILPLLLLLTVSNAYCERLHIIRFVHGGDETQPVGTLVISVEKNIHPYDEKGRTGFGHTFQTDLITFMAIRNFIKSKKYLSVSKPKEAFEWFTIFDSDGTIHYLYGRITNKFFNELKLSLTKKGLDKRIIDILNVY